MAYFAYIILFFSVVNFLLGLVILIQAEKSKENIFFLLFATIVSLWTFNNFLLRVNQNISFLRLSYGIGILVAITGLIWIFLFLKKPIPFLLKAVVLPFSIVVFYITSFSNYAVVSLDSITLLGYEGRVGLFFPVYSLSIGVIVITIIYQLISSFLKEKDAIKKGQILYTLIGSISFSVISFVVSFFIPMIFRSFQFTALDNLSFSIFLLFIVLAILKHHLFDIKVIATELLAFTIWIALLVNIFSSSSLQGFLATSIVFVAVIIAGILLIRSVIKEVHQREQIEKLAKELERAYEVEKHANEELEKLDKFKDQFLMTTQHNLRTPLTAMRGYTDLILGGVFGKQPKKTIEVMGKLKTLTDGMIKMVNDFLDMAKFQLGKDVVTLKPNIELLPILDEIIGELEFVAKQKEVDLKFEKPNTPIVITADREKLKAALFNIVDNSIKYTPKGHVVVNVVQGQTANITVSDTGIGIPKERLNLLFESMFERGSQAQKVSTTGSGIGLFLSGQIIKSHKGKVWAESEGEGKGSIFHIELPLDTSGPVKEEPKEALPLGKKV